MKEEGNALYRKREFEEALAKYTEAKDTDPDDKTIVYDLNISGLRAYLFSDCVSLVAVWLCACCMYMWLAVGVAAHGFCL